MYAYNPRKKTYQQLEESMVGHDRWDILDTIRREMDLKKGEGPKQHWMIIGPRGIGKSHLMTLLYHKIKNDPKLSKKWIPILFPEELRMERSLQKLLARALKEIVLEFEQKESPLFNELKQKIDLIKTAPIKERADHYFSLISWFSRETGKHILLLAENLQYLLGKKLAEIEQKKLRAFIQTSNALLIVGSATTVFDALHDHSHPFYHFFHVKRLKDLNFSEMKTLIRNILLQRQQPELSEKLTEEDARLKALYSFTDGNPRMAVFLADIFSTEVPEEMIDIMDRVLDELTPYFESIVGGIPDYLEEVVNTLASFEPAQSPKEIAQYLEIPQTSIRNYLKQLKEDGYVRIAFSKGKSNYYCLGEYLYRMWFQMRNNMRREETRWLTELLLTAYSREKISEWKADDSQDLIEIDLEYFKSLESSKEKKSEIINLFLNLFIVQTQKGINGESVEAVIKQIRGNDDIPFSDVILKVWKCLNDPESVEAQKYLAEKGIVEIVAQIREKAKPKKVDQNKNSISNIKLKVVIDEKGHKITLP
ncbi:MAG: ArsR family transcriptional regulator [bacterium]|nr:ArsR family transcriptional regulator [bacterium]